MPVPAWPGTAGRAGAAGAAAGSRLGDRPLRLELDRGDVAVADVERSHELHGRSRIHASLGQRRVGSVDRLALFVDGRDRKTNVLGSALAGVAQRSLDDERGAVLLARVVRDFDPRLSGGLGLLVLVLVLAGRLGEIERVRNVRVRDAHLRLLTVLLTVLDAAGRVGRIRGRRGRGRRRSRRSPVGGGGGVPVDLRDGDREERPVGPRDVGRRSPANDRLLERDDRAALEDDDVGQGSRREPEEGRDDPAHAATAHCCSFQFC